MTNLLIVFANYLLLTTALQQQSNPPRAVVIPERIAPTPNVALALTNPPKSRPSVAPVV